MATIRILKRYDDDTCGHTDENAGISSTWHRDTWPNGRFICVNHLSDYSHLTLRAIVAGESGRATKCTVLAVWWKHGAGHCDEAIHMAGRMVFRLHCLRLCVMQ